MSDALTKAQQANHELNLSDMNWCDARIKNLETENAALKKSVKYWASHAPTDEYVDQLLAAQLRIKSLREALDYMVRSAAGMGCGLKIADDALATQDNTAEIDALVQRAEQHTELIMAVARKWPNETRHETALRYIKEVESREVAGPCGGAAMKETKK